MSRYIPAPLTLSGFVAAALAAIVLAAGAWWVTAQQTEAAEWVRRSHEVLTVVARTRAALVDVQNGHRGFTISGDERELEPYYRGRHALETEMNSLGKLLAAEPEQESRFAGLQEAIRLRLESAAQLVEARRRGGFGAAKSIVDTGRPSIEMQNVREALDAIEGEETRLLDVRLAERARKLQTFWTGIATLVVVLLATLAVLYAQIRRRRRVEWQLLESEDELQRLNESLESTVELRTHELQEANHELSAARQRLRHLSAQLITAQEQERRHIARELHDETGQSLTAIRLHLADVMQARDGAMERLPECVGLVDRTIAQIRGMALNLRPTMLDDLGLVEALEWLATERFKAAGWELTLDAQELLADPHPDVKTACFRIAQEALTNAARHAQATEVRVALSMKGDTLHLTVTDNGVGFDVDELASGRLGRAHFGMASMPERADLVGGTFRVESAPGIGTRIRASFPVNQPSFETALAA